MLDQWKTFAPYFQLQPSSKILIITNPDTPQAGFEPAQNLSLDIVRSSYAVVSHDLKFDDFNLCDNGDIKFLIYLEILQDHMIKGSLTLWVGAPDGRSPSCQDLWP